MQKVMAFLVCAAAAVFALLLTSSPGIGQPVTGGAGLTRVAHDSSMVGSGTTPAPLGLRKDCASTQVLVWNGTSWACGTAGETLTGGAGLVKTGTVMDVIGSTGITVLADSVTLSLAGASCSAGSHMSSLSATGTGTCVAEVGDISTVTTTANMGLTGGGTTGAVSVGLLSTCADGQVLKSGATGTTWTCANDTGESTIAGAGLTLTGTTVDLVASSDFSVTADLLDLSAAVGAPGSLTVATTLGVTGLSTLTGGATSPANLTTTGTGDLVSGDQLTVASHATISGNATVAGNATLGDNSALDTHTINGFTNIVGAGVGTSVFAKDGSLNCNFADNATSTCYINQYGFNGGTTQYRNLTVSNGNGGTIARFNAATLLTEMFGGATIYGNATLGDAGTDNHNIVGTLAITGNTTSTGYMAPLFITGKLGSPPTLSACGTTPTITANSTNLAGSFTTGSATGTSCTVTWSNGTAPATPVCWVTTAAAGTGKSLIVPTTVSTTDMTMTAQLASSTAYQYICPGSQ